MSYASVAAHNAPPPSEQPHPDPNLLNTTPPSAPNVIDDMSKVNLVTPDYKRNPATRTSESHRYTYDDNDNNDNHSRPRNKRLKEVEAESLYLWEITKYYLFRPGVAGGFLGLINVGLLAYVGRAYYTQPYLRKDKMVISSTVAATLALLSLEGYGVEKYRQTPQGQREARRAKEEGTLVYRYLHEHILRPRVLGGFIGCVNTAILGTVGYFSYINWDKERWDRRTVSAVTVGILALWSGEGLLAGIMGKR